MGWSVTRGKQAPPTRDHSAQRLLEDADKPWRVARGAAGHHPSPVANAELQHGISPKFDLDVLAHDIV